MNVVAIFGVPRSGTSWLGQIFNSSPHVVYRYQPLFSYSFKEQIDAESSEREVREFYQALIDTQDEFVTQKKNISGRDTPDFEKNSITHLVWKEVRYLHLIESIIQKSETKIVGIIRHPCSVLYSWINAPKEFDENWTLEDEWKKAPKKNKNKEENFFGYDKWKEAANLFLNLHKKYPDRFFLQVYERLNNDPVKSTQDIFRFTGLTIGEQTETFLKDSTTTSSDDPYGVHRKKKQNHEWIGNLPREIVQSVLEDEEFKQINKQIKWDIE